MRNLSLRSRLILWSGTASAVTLAFVVVLVDLTFRANIREQLGSGLSFAVQVAEAARKGQVESRIAETVTMALDTRLRAAVETGDPATVTQTLTEVYPSPSGWAAVLTRDGNVLAATGDAPFARLAAAKSLLDEALYYDTGDVWRIGDQVTDVAASAILFGATPLAVLVTGQPLRTATVSALETAVGRPVGVLVGSRLILGREAQDLPAGARDDLRAHAADGGVEMARLGTERFFIASTPLRSGDDERVGTAVLLSSYDDALHPSNTLRAALIGIFFIGLLVTIGVSGVFSRGVTVPVGRLLGDTERLARGKLDRPITPVRDDEIGRLARAFDHMRVSLKTANAELIRAERLGAIGQAASAVAHDFTQPISTIAGAVGLLRMDGDDPAIRDKYLGAIESQVNRLQRMKQEIVEFARGESVFDAAEVQIDGFLENTATGLRSDLESRDITLRIEHGYAGAWYLDSYRLGRVIENLIRNAAAALNREGTITVRSAREGESLIFEVADDGPGIPADLLDDIFEPFVSHGKKEGTGLGLAIARNVARQHGGTIDVTSKPGSTCFRVVIPPHRDRRPSQPHPTPALVTV